MSKNSHTRFANKGKSPSSSSFKSPVNVADLKITKLEDVDPMIDDIAVKARCISLWHSHRKGAEKNPYSLDCVLQDEEGTRIEVFIKKEFKYAFEPLLVEGQCYVISNFAVAENGGTLPLLPHKWKIVFYRHTILTRIDPFNEDLHGFQFEPFNSLLDVSNRYETSDYVDVVGTVVAIGDIVPVNSKWGKKTRRDVLLEDAQSFRIKLTFWDNWASMWNDYSQKRDTLGCLIVIVQLGKVKYWDDTPAVHNALFGTKVFMDSSFPEIVNFRKSLQEREDFNETDFKIELYTPPKNIESPSEFMSGCVKQMVGTIRDTHPDSQCVVYATIHKIMQDEGWAYTACKICNKRVEIIPAKAYGPSRNRKPTFHCDSHGTVNAAPVFKLILRFADETGSASAVFFNSTVFKLCGKTAWEIMEKKGMNPDEYFPDDLDVIVGKKAMLKIYYSEYNHSRNSHKYRCDAVCQDPDVISYFQDGFLESDDQSDQFKTPIMLLKPPRPLKSTYQCVTKTLDLDTPPTKNNETSSNVDGNTKQSPGSSDGSNEKKREHVQYIDLEDYPSDLEDAEPNPLKKPMVQVKIEKDP